MSRITGIVRVLIMTVAVGLVLAAPGHAAETSSGSTRCGTDHDGRAVCVAPADTYPDARGWYGWTGPPMACGPTPFPGYFPEGEFGICMMPAPINGYRWVGGEWSVVPIGAGQKTYVYPYAANWRWIWTQQTGWIAYPSRSLLLKWNPTL